MQRENVRRLYLFISIGPFTECTQITFGEFNCIKRRAAIRFLVPIRAFLKNLYYPTFKLEKFSKFFLISLV